MLPRHCHFSQHEFFLCESRLLRISLTMSLLEYTASLLNRESPTFGDFRMATLMRLRYSSETCSDSFGVVSTIIATNIIHRGMYNRLSALTWETVRLDHGPQNRIEVVCWPPTLLGGMSSVKSVHCHRQSLRSKMGSPCIPRCCTIILDQPCRHQSQGSEVADMDDLPISRYI